MCRYSLLLLCWIFPFLAEAQQDQQVSQYMFSQLSINPGAAGSNDVVCANGILRQQWTGIDGAPYSFIGGIDFPFKLFKKDHGIGVSITYDEIGFYKDISLKPTYAFRANVGNGKLGIGITLNIQNRTLEPDWQIPTGTDFHIDYSQDPSIPENEDPIFAMDIGFGFFYKTDELYVGISSTHINEGIFKYVEASKDPVNVKLKRHYYISSGYNIQLANPSFELMPSMFIQSDGSIHKLDLNMTMLYNKKFWVGVTYRPGSAVVGMVGLEIINGMKIGYAYDFDTSAIMEHTKMPFELAVSYCFKIGIEKSPQKYKSIRFL